MIALSTPGYCTFTATTRPSGITARCTWPIDAAATGIGFQSRKSFSGSAPSSSRTTPSARLGAIGGTSACSVASAACASGGRPSAMNEIIWPAFMMAPFMLPSTSATSSAVRMANCSSSRARSSSVALRPRTFIAAQCAPRRVVSRHTRAWRSSRWRRSRSESATPTPAPASRPVAMPSGIPLRNGGASAQPVGRGAWPSATAWSSTQKRVRRHGFEAGVADGLAARLTRPVGAVVEPAQRVLDVAQLGFDLLEDREVLLALERLGAEVGLVLVEARQLREVLVLGLVVEMLVGERVAHALESGSLVVQPLAGLVGVHHPTLPMERRAASRARGRRRSRGWSRRE